MMTTASPTPDRRSRPSTSPPSAMSPPSRRASTRWCAIFATASGSRALTGFMCQASAAMPRGPRAGLKEVGDVLLAPVANSFLRDVRHPAFAFRIGAAGETLLGDGAAEEIPRAVAFRAMAETVHEIGAAIPARRARRIRHEGLAVHEQPFPDSDIAPDIE